MEVAHCHSAIETKLRGFSMQANYTDWPTAACRRTECQLLRTVVAWSEKWIPKDGNLDFLNLESLLYIQVAPQLSWRDWEDPVPDPLLSENLVALGIESGVSGSVARNSDH
jgi:hypothetical protein